MAYGFIYVLANEFMPAIYKIGFTTKHPRERMAELSSSTSCPVKFELLAFIDSEYPQLIEKDIHSQLGNLRINGSREFFRAEPSLILNILRQQCDALMGIYWAVELEALVDQLKYQRGINY